LILHPTYFPSILHYVALAQSNKVVFEVEDNYQKQTYRTRCYIYGANGRQLLTVPVLHPVQQKKTKEVQIDYSFNWQKQHLKSIQTAYRSSPFFEFYEEDLLPIFSQKKKYLLDFNIQVHQVLQELLQLEISYSKTKEYQNNSDIDLRYLVDAKSKETYNLGSYFQIFSDKYGFMENLSILDLLFMEGTNALNYLEQQQVKFI